MAPWRRSGRIWILTTLLLTIGSAVSLILASIILDALMQRPAGGGSMTTMMPGAVYASVTVTKVCMICGGAAAFVTVGAWLIGHPARRPAAEAVEPALPVCGLSSIALIVSTPCVGAVAAVIAQAVTGGEPPLLLGDLPGISRTAVFVQLAVLVIGAISAGVSLARHERPRLVALLGLTAGVVLIGLFWHFQFYARGFDQDTWAPR